MNFVPQLGAEIYCSDSENPMRNVQGEVVVTYASWHICMWVPFIHKEIEENRPDRIAERGHTSFHFQCYFDIPPPFTLDLLHIGLWRHENFCSLRLLLQHYFNVNEIINRYRKFHERGTWSFIYSHNSPEANYWGLNFESQAVYSIF